MTFDSLFSPLQIGPIEIKNRIQSTPHEQQYFENGLSSETLLHYFVDRAKGGAGLLELSQLYVKEPPIWRYDSARRFPMVSTPEIVPGLRDLARGVHEYGAKIFMEVSAWNRVLGPVSEMPMDTGVQLRQLSLSDIREIQEAFGVASRYVKESGFDGIDLHGTHGSMIEHFYSPATNMRDDRYGGSLENRMRFLFEIVEIVRASVGDSMAVGMRMCADEKIEHGVTPEYASKMGELFDGKIDFATVGSGSSNYYEVLNQRAHQAEPLYALTGYTTMLAGAVKKSVKETKIGAVGRILDPLLGDEVIKKGLADYVGMTRALIADAELPNKAREGRLEEIRPCIGTLQDCWGRSVAHDWPMRCTVNPTVGLEKERGIGLITPAVIKKKVLIVGAGPAGMEAARVTSERGHDVVIYEKGKQIGGQANLAKLLPGRTDIGAIITWYVNQLRSREVRVELNKEVTAEVEVIRYLVDEEKPDAVLIATGSTPIRNGIQYLTYREIPGWDRGNVYSVDSVLSQANDLKGDVVVADSTSYITGPGIAEWIARKGAKSVTLVTPNPHIAPELANYNQLVYVMNRLSDASVKVVPFSWLVRIPEDGVVIRDFTSQSEKKLPADQVVLNTGRRQYGAELKERFKSLVDEVYEIGDCNIAGETLAFAIDSGYQVGVAI